MNPLFFLDSFILLAKLTNMLRTKYNPLQFYQWKTITIDSIDEFLSLGVKPKNLPDRYSVTTELISYRAFDDYAYKLTLNDNITGKQYF